MLPGQEKSPEPLALAANDHAWKPLVPPALRHLRLGVQPAREQSELFRRNLAVLDPVEQMPKKGGRYVLTSDLGHECWAQTSDRKKIARFRKSRASGVPSSAKPHSGRQQPPTFSP